MSDALNIGIPILCLLGLLALIIWKGEREERRYHGGLNRKTNALNSIVVRARDALDGTLSKVTT